MNEGLLNTVLVLAAIYFVANTVLFIIVAIAAMKAAKAIKDIQPRLEVLAEKVEKAADDVGKLTKLVQGTVNTVGARALGAVSSAQEMAGAASKGIGRFSPYLAGALTLYKVLTSIRDLRKKR